MGVTYSNCEPVTLGKHRIGIMRATKLQPIVPMTTEYFPRFHGPGLKRSPTRKTRMKMGMVKALRDVY